MEEKDEKRITLRVSPALYDKVASVAHSKNMSVNGFVITALEQAVDPQSLENRLAAMEEKIRYMVGH